MTSKKVFWAVRTRKADREPKRGRTKAHEDCRTDLPTKLNHNAPDEIEARIQRAMKGKS